MDGGGSGRTPLLPGNQVTLPSGYVPANAEQGVSGVMYQYMGPPPPSQPGPNRSFNSSFPQHFSPAHPLSHAQQGYRPQQPPSPSGTPVPGQQQRSGSQLLQPQQPQQSGMLSRSGIIGSTGGRPSRGPSPSPLMSSSPVSSVSSIGMNSNAEDDPRRFYAQPGLSSGQQPHPQQFGVYHPGGIPKQHVGLPPPQPLVPSPSPRSLAASIPSVSPPVGTAAASNFGGAMYTQEQPGSQFGSGQRVQAGLLQSHCRPPSTPMRPGPLRPYEAKVLAVAPPQSMRGHPPRMNCRGGSMIPGRTADSPLESPRFSQSSGKLVPPVSPTQQHMQQQRSQLQAALQMQQPLSLQQQMYLSTASVSPQSPSPMRQAMGNFMDLEPPRHRGGRPMAPASHLSSNVYTSSVVPGNTSYRPPLSAGDAHNFSGFSNPAVLRMQQQQQQQRQPQPSEQHMSSPSNRMVVNVPQRTYPVARMAPFRATSPASLGTLPLSLSDLSTQLSSSPATSSGRQAPASPASSSLPSGSCSAERHMIRNSPDMGNTSGGGNTTPTGVVLSANRSSESLTGALPTAVYALSATSGGSHGHLPSTQMTATTTPASTGSATPSSVVLESGCVGEGVNAAAPMHGPTGAASGSIGTSSGYAAQGLTTVGLPSTASTPLPLSASMQQPSQQTQVQASSGTPSVTLQQPRSSVSSAVPCMSSVPATSVPIGVNGLPSTSHVFRDTRVAVSSWLAQQQRQQVALGSAIRVDTGLGSGTDMEYSYTECFLRGLANGERVQDMPHKLSQLLAGLAGTQPSIGVWKTECWRSAVDPEALATTSGRLIQSSSGFNGELWVRRYSEPSHLRSFHCLRMYSPEHLVGSPYIPVNARRVKEAAVAPQFLKFLPSMGFRKSATNDVFVSALLFHHNSHGAEGHLLVSIQKHYKDEKLSVDLFPGKYVVEVTGRVEDDMMIESLFGRILDLCRRMQPFVQFNKF